VSENTTLVLVGLIVFAFVVSRLLHRYAERVALVSGIEYAIVGALIGPAGPFDLITEQTLQSLDLLVTLLLGSLGFTVGLHARDALRRFEHFLAGSVAGVLVALSVGLVTLGLFQWLDPRHLDDPSPLVAIPVWTDGARLYQVWAAKDAVWLALTLGAAAAIASSTAIESAVERWRAKGPPVDLLRDLASAGQIMAILLFGFALAGDRAVESAGGYGLSLVEWSMLTAAAGAITGLLFTIFIGGAEDDLRLYLATLGVVIFAAGIGGALGVSPMFVNLVAGLTVAATSQHGEHLRDNLDRLHRPASILVLVFAGLAWRPVSGWLWLIPLAYLLTRVLARLWASRFAVSTFVHGVELRRVGGGLIGQGSLAAAIALSYSRGHPQYGPIVLTAVLVPMLITDLFAVRTLRRVLANAGAIRPRATGRPDEDGLEAADDPDAADDHHKAPADHDAAAELAHEASHGGHP
jgi:Kef-type K+ transport system membrane component KefB